MHSVLVATRKGLFHVRGEGRRWEIGTPHFAGEPVSQVLADPRDGTWYAALRLGHFGVKLHRSDDRGASWQEVAAPAFPPKPTEGPWADDATPWSVDLVWSLAAGGADAPGVIWAGCMPAGLFRSDDRGASWKVNEALWHEPRRREWLGGGYDHAGIHSIAVDPRDARHVTLGISCGGAWQTRDDGATWELTARGMRADFMPPERADDGNIQDLHGLVQCAAAPDTLWVQHHGGIYRSIDGGHNWQPLEPPKPTGFGFAVACDPRDPARAWFVPAEADAKRIPIDGRVVVSRTDDGGATFRICGEGLPARDAFHLVYRHALDVTADGSTLAMASTTGGLWSSADAGESWHCISRDLPPVAAVRFA